MRGWRGAALTLGVALLALAAIAPRAEAQYFGQNKVQYRQYQWKSISSDHFEVYFYTGLDSLAMRVLDLAEKANVMLSARMGHPLSHRVPLILYGSHNDFAETNVTPELIDEGTGGFTEVLHNRVVLPFTGSYEDLRHVVVHELTHAFMFDMFYGGSATAMLARQTFYSVPLWFAEGMAEYFSLGMESNAEMFLRDGVIEGYLPPLYVSGGYIVYKQGQSALSYLVDRYGEERLRDLMRRIRQTHNFDGAFQRSVGTSVEKFDMQWREWLKRKYWPTVAVKQDPEQFARRLTDHRHDESNLNTAPAVSPQGDRIAYFSDRRQYTDVYVMSAIDGKMQHRIIRGERNVAFEAIPSFRSSITWSPDGQLIAMTAKSRGSDVIYVMTSREGQLLKRFDLHCDALAFPAWSPRGDSLVVVGVKDGRSDLWMLNVTTAKITRLTNDTYDEKEPAWTPDGTGITFSSDRVTPVVLHARRLEKGYGRYGLFTLDLASGQVRPLLDTSGDDHSPAWSADGSKLAFISDRNGTPNIFLFDRHDSTVTQLTDVTGGVSSLTWSRQNDRLVFSAYNHGGFDVFAVKEPLSLDAVIARLHRQAPQSFMSAADAHTAAPADSTPLEPPNHGALAGAWPESLSMAKDTALTSPHNAPEPPLAAGGHVDTLRANAHGNEPPAWTGGGHESFPPRPDTLPPLATTIPIVDNGGPFVLPDSVLGQKPNPYRPHLTPDYAGSTIIAATGYGYAGNTQFSFTDFLGNHNLYIATDLLGGSLEETNALAIYSYLPRRWDFSAGAFHFKNYYSGRVTTLGEQLTSPRQFSERNFGALATMAYPMDRFHRIEFNYTQMFVERKFYEPNDLGDYVVVQRQYRSVSSPSISLVGDNTLFGYYGPVNGQRYNVTYSPSFDWFPNGLEYHTATWDSRRYWDFTHGYTFVTRTLMGFSGGRDPQVFRVGGFSTLRGYSDYDLLGTRLAIANVELRFPFIQQLGLVGPVPIGVFNLRGVAFADGGVIWNDDRPLEWKPLRTAVQPHNGFATGFGGGIRTAVAFMILKLDVAWSTDFVGVSAPRYYFSIGPEL